ncbi:tRNA pseudouridine synthase C [Candidatus Ornithobacterium hominis]|uniref:tRNA pseudouridine synthase C n=1 Tax=Candidatus Ornithobacterium hominis TaxID=2497989 RepID=A0A383U5K9_9FLAO|nr:RluA family pseudouridine synthase [Candidatus Ornithobacterium hominis]MCT7905160.1 RluA family pseudouridine synthase [Candidatus Ornithobacterium hominis]SZD74233.1 tRNA pseudouridine synthase C [Candidatus Ornithobacterium hominis]
MWKPEILWEDNHLMIVNKACGDLVQGDKTGDESLLDKIKAFIKIRDNKSGNVYLGLVHRLDRPTSGVVIFAKTSKALGRMNQMFKNREVDKIYWAITEPANPNIPEKATLEHYLKKNSKKNFVSVYHQPTKDAKKAILHYELKQKLNHFWWYEIRLETGRSHQIRAQLASIGASIKGDLKYGASRSNRDGGIHLHARSAAFIHPVSKEKILVEAPPPEETLWQAIL